jgi:DNA-binding NarL/FixJ family response regulator
MPLQILVADKHRSYRKNICAILRSVKGWEICVEAETGEEAIEGARKWRPDVAILDSDLPSIDALEVARQIRTIDVATEVLILCRAEERQLYASKMALIGVRGCLLPEQAESLLVPAVDALRRGKPYMSPSLTTFWEQPDNDNSVVPFRLPSRRVKLTKREIEVVRLVVEGCSNKETAKALNITVKTIESHRARIMRKLGLHSVVELVRYAIREGIVAP